MGHDPFGGALTRLVAALAEEAIFTFSAAKNSFGEALEGTARRRADAHTLVVTGGHVASMEGEFDAWLVEMARELAPVAPPVWMPMADLFREKVTLEVGARGLRSLFSSKPSEKETLRVKRLGTLAVRLLRAVFAADGPIDAEEARTIAAVIASLGLPDADAAPLYTEAPVPLGQLDVYGEIEAPVARALVSGAWLAAAWDAIDPREEQVIRTAASKIAFDAEDLESARAEAIKAVDARRTAGLATVDYVRYILADRVPGEGVTLAAKAGKLMLPRRFRDEALGQIGHGIPVTLARRYLATSQEERLAILGIAWAAALHGDPTLSRRALLAARHDKLSADLDFDGPKARLIVEDWMRNQLEPIAFGMANPGGR
jgi:hypothetical protein